MKRWILFRWGLVCAVTAAALPFGGAEAAVKSPEKVYGETRDDKALVYFVREPYLVGKARTMFLYADDEFLGVVDDDGYTFAHVEPGRRLLWLNFTRINLEFEFRSGDVYYFAVSDHLRHLPAIEGRDAVEKVSQFCTPEDRERSSAAKQIGSRRDRAGRKAAKETGEYSGAKAARDRHVAQWPRLDLSAYRVLVIEDFPVTDPKAEERKQIHLVRTAPARVADFVRTNVDPDLFEEVRRGPAGAVEDDVLVLRVELTQYKPGSQAARMMMAGAGAARLDFDARLIDGATGLELARFADERAYGWGGTMGAVGGIETIERNLAHELSVYLRECKKGASSGDAPSQGPRVEPL